jgi:hypothetical protein
MGFNQQPGLPPRLSERAQNMFVSSNHFVDLGARALIAKVGSEACAAGDGADDSSGRC